MDENGQVPQLDLTAENAFSKMFEGAQSASGDQELLKIASDFASQFSGDQIRTLCFVEGLIAHKPTAPFSKRMRPIIDKYIEYKRNHNSAMYVMAALDSIALRKLVNENTMKINIQK